MLNAEETVSWNNILVCNSIDRAEEPNCSHTAIVVTDAVVTATVVAATVVKVQQSHVRTNRQTKTMDQPTIRSKNTA